MIKEAIGELTLAPFAVIGLVVFVTVFLGVVAWVATRGRKQIDTWSRLPLSDDHEPLEPRRSGSGRQGSGGGESGCGDCVECSCRSDAALELITIN